MKFQASSINKMNQSTVRTILISLVISQIASHHGPRPKKPAECPNKDTTTCSAPTSVFSDRSCTCVCPKDDTCLKPKHPSSANACACECPNKADCAALSATHDYNDADCTCTCKTVLTCDAPTPFWNKKTCACQATRPLPPSCKP